MSSDDQIRAAFDDLANRAAAAASQAPEPMELPSSRLPVGRGNGGRRFLAAAAAVVVVTAGAAVLLNQGDGQDVAVDLNAGGAAQVAEPSSSDEALADDDPLDEAPLDEEGQQPEAGSGPSPDQEPPLEVDPSFDVQPGDRLQVRTDLVEAAADPWLNARLAPNASTDENIVYRLSPSYAELEATGQVEQADDGGTWIAVWLRQPVTEPEISDVELDQPLWVNAAFVEPAIDPVPTDGDMATVERFVIATREIAAAADAASAQDALTAAGATLFADEVTILLASGEGQRTVVGTSVYEAASWRFDLEEGFVGLSGPFDLLAIVDEPYKVSVGPVDHCTAPPVVWPSELDGLKQLNIEPTGIDSCLLRYNIILFLDRDDRIAAVALDLWGP